VERVIRAVALELCGLFVDDGAVAVVAIVALLSVALFVQHQGDGHSIAGIFLIVGVLIAVWAGLYGASKARSLSTRADSSEPKEQLSSSHGGASSAARDPELITRH
jgi:hypothetical protein